MRLLKFILGIALLACGGLLLVSSSYALVGAAKEGVAKQALNPLMFAIGSIFAGFIGLRLALRAIIPGFTFTRLILVGIALVLLGHFTGYALPAGTMKTISTAVLGKARAVQSVLPAWLRFGDEKPER